MITLQIIGDSTQGYLELEDTVSVQKWSGGLALVESDHIYVFDKLGEYLGSGPRDLEEQT